MQDLRDLARERESLTVVVSSTKNEIKRILQILFPELESLGDVFSQTMLYFLEEFPSARIIKTANLRAIAKAFEHSDKRKKISVSSSKRGNRHLRRVIFLMAKHVSRDNPFLRTYYLKRRKEKLSFKEAILATAHKLIRVIFAMFSNRTYSLLRRINSS